MKYWTYCIVAVILEYVLNNNNNKLIIVYIIIIIFNYFPIVSTDFLTSIHDEDDDCM